MATSRLYIAGLLGALAVAAGPLPGANHAYGFDPSKVFEGEMSPQKIFKFYFDARKNGQPEEAVSVLKYAAEHGNQAAKWKLGRMYETGDGVECDPLTAFNIFKGITEQYSGANPN